MIGKVLEVFTFPKAGGYMGGVATMVKSYVSDNTEFSKYDITTELFDAKSKLAIGNSKIDNIIYLFTQRHDIIKHLRHNSYDVIHIHTSCRFLFFKDILLVKSIKKRHNVPIVLTIHVGAIDTVFHQFTWFRNSAIKIMNRYLDAIIYLAKPIMNDFIQIGLSDNKAHLLYNFHTLSVPFSKKDNDRLELLFVGAIHREKGIFELLNALKYFSEGEVHLNICGQLTDAAMQAEFDKLIEELGKKVTLLGYVSGDMKASVFRNADILILPSYHEGLPLVIMEALGAGCGIIATPVGAMPEILSDDNACWVGIGSVEDIVCKLRLFCNDKSKLRRMQKTNYQLGKQYSFESHIAQLSRIYKAV